MLDRDIEDSRVTQIVRTGYPITPRIKPTFKPELIEVAELSAENYAEIVFNRSKQYDNT